MTEENKEAPSQPEERGPKPPEDRGPKPPEERGPKPPGAESDGPPKRFRRFGGGRRRKCTPCDDVVFDWKDVAFLSRFQTPTGKMMSRKRTGYCAQCQRQLAQAIKRARFMSLVPYVS